MTNGTDCHFVLVVDSSERIRVLMADVLVSRGYVVHTTASVEAALALVTQVAFSVVVVGASELARGAGDGIKKLLAQPGILRAVVFYEPVENSVTPDFPAGVLQVLPANKRNQLAERLRSVIPPASTLHDNSNLRPTNGHPPS
ncbi:response regulator [bacterium]|nr:MAG: response regulator [bacterium]RIK64151.1 MAG: hypothetical protein DCC64_05410 [Planctomycetota bacterium]